jgi:hypothetical protein
MKRGMLVTLTLLACVSLAGVVFAQDNPSGARPMFAVLPPHSYYPVKPADPAAQLAQWKLTWHSSWNNRDFTSTFVGTDPSTTNTTTTVTVGIIPIKMVYGASNGNKTFDPNDKYVGNYSAIQMLMLSPLFQKYIDFNQGGTDLGSTQYIDAYERGNFWSSVQTNNKYHVLLKTVLGPTQTINVSASQGNVINNPWGGYPTGTMDINSFDVQLQTIMNNFSQIQPNVLPLFVTYNVYLTSGGCCIGGYHSANGGAPGGQTYSHTSLMSQASVPVFSEDVSAAAHELGEWLLDPFTTNGSPCPSNGILENGDPLVSDSNPQFGAFPYTVQGFTFHPQDLVFLSWFGQTPSTAVNSWTRFQGETLGVCQLAH